MKPEAATVLVIDDDENFHRFVDLALGSRYRLIHDHQGDRLRDVLAGEGVDVLLLDLKLPHHNGLNLLEEVHHLDATIEVIILTVVREIPEVVRAMKAGAYDYLTKDLDFSLLEEVVRRAVMHRRQKLELETLRLEVQRFPFHRLHWGCSERMQTVRSQVVRASAAPSSVLLTGESGVGKEMVARELHLLSPRSREPFLAVNVCAIPDNLVESTLFGHERGSFTGATRTKRGCFEQVRSGSLFLDEVGDLRQDTQVKLLRVLQERSFERVGGEARIPVRCRIITATNRDLRTMVARGTFREDLFYRINVVPIELPPLRERLEDLPMLIAHFLDKHNRILSRKVIGLNEEAMAALRCYPWPGNVRELENLVERLIVLNGDGLLGLHDLPLEYYLRGACADPKSRCGEYRTSMESYERELLRRVLEQCRGHRRRAAARLGVPLSTLKFRLAKLGLHATPRNETESSHRDTTSQSGKPKKGRSPGSGPINLT
ncbi:MAG: hypothetical protein A2284_08550 [Deltaproteobacteria bacterium RIFOXYA12_FULL_61_11]|nr:MAG: hypothetical protein A2284_08550 [Deltaproteobacteria bacterium RIFOXYA12_FULL_61_11]